jgi:hypothetical protein
VTPWQHSPPPHALPSGRQPVSVHISADICLGYGCKVWFNVRANCAETRCDHSSLNRRFRWTRQERDEGSLPFMLFMSMVWCYVSELQPRTCLLFIPLIYEYGEPRWNDMFKRNPGPSITLSTSPTRTDRGANPDLRCERPATNCLSPLSSLPSNEPHPRGSWMNSTSYFHEFRFNIITPYAPSACFPLCFSN